MKISINCNACAYPILLLFFMILFVRCNSCNQENNLSVKDCDAILNNKKIVDRKVKIYQVSEIFYNFLDSAIESEKKCSFYTKCTSGFLFTTYKSKDYYKIQINSINIYRYDYSKCLGIFEYKDYRFVCDSLFIPKLLKATNKFINIKYMDIDRSNWMNINDDRASTWFFTYKNDSILLKGHHSCY